MKTGIIFRKPTLEDGAAIWHLVKTTGRLDLNSAYLYLLLARDFADTCVVAAEGERLVGFVSGYRPPGRPGRAWRPAVLRDGIGSSCFSRRRTGRRWRC